MSRWYRAYAGTVKDDKLAEVSVIAGCSRSVAIAVWHAILESAAETDDGGRFETTPRRVAAALCEPLAAVQAVFDAMTEIAMIGGDSVTAWKNRQYESDKSTERSRKHREAKRNGGATLQERCATPPETEADTDTETDKDASKPASLDAGQREEFLERAERRCTEAAGSSQLGPFLPISGLLFGGIVSLDDAVAIIRSRPAVGGVVSSWKFYAKIIQDEAAKLPSPSQGPPKVHVMSGTPEWDAWTAFNGKAKPIDKTGGFYFPSRWPPTPTISNAEEAA